MGGAADALVDAAPWIGLWVGAVFVAFALWVAVVVLEERRCKRRAERLNSQRGRGV